MTASTPSGASPPPTPRWLAFATPAASRPCSTSGAPPVSGPRQQLPDEGEQAHQVVTAAAKHGAYVVVGHIPVAFGKTPLGDYRVLLRGDPDLRRTFVLVEPGPRHPAGAAQRALARRLAEYLLGPRGQAALVEANQAIATPERPGPWVFPLPR